jgi:hypothetical protein
MTKTKGSGSISQRHGSPDPDPPQNVMDPQHCFEVVKIAVDYIEISLGNFVMSFFSS